MKKWIYGGVVAAVYAGLTVAFAPISYGPVQFRVSEALTVLPFLYPYTVWGLFLGCLLANYFGGLGVYDVVGGSLLTLLAGYLTSKMPKDYLAPLPPVVVNMFGVAVYLHWLFNMPYFLTAAYIGLGEGVVVYALGYPFLKWIERQKKRRGNRDGFY